MSNQRPMGSWRPAATPRNAGAHIKDAYIDARRRPSVDYAKLYTKRKSRAPRTLTDAEVDALIEQADD